MLKKIVLVLAILIAGLLIYAGVKEPAMNISRQLSIHASSEKIFPYINNTQKADEWMPWKDSDPTAVMNYSGPAEGVGAKSTWDSPGQMGTGQAEIIESIPNKSVKTQLTYTKPMTMAQVAEITLSPGASADETLVTWSVNGHSTFIFRLIGIFMDCDKMVGGEFEKGLAKLKQIVEAN